jgi:pimeloyl-ACP methyl ester carboxylesterase
VVTFDAPAHGFSEGTSTNYFEFTDVIRSFIKTGNGYDVAAAIGHSLGAGAIVNSLSKERISIPAVLLAPALKLKEVLYNTFDLYGIPKNLYRHMISNFEQIYGYSLTRDNPVRLIPDVTAPILIVHDRDDSMIPYMDSRSVVEKNIAVKLRTTAGLGHKQILLDERVLSTSLKYLEDHCCQPVQHLRMA